MTDDKPSTGIHISGSGNVQGIFGGKKVTITSSTITIGNQTVPVEKEPKPDELKQLLAEIQQELAQVTAQTEALKAVSTAAPHVAKGAEENVKDAAGKVETEMKPEEAKSVQQSLAEATSLLSGILDGAKIVAQKAGEVGQAVKPMVEQLEPLVEKLGVATLWVAKLWIG